MPEAVINLLKGDSKGSETDYRDYLPINMSGIVREMFGVKGYMLQQPGLTQLGSGSGIDRRGIWNERFEDHYRVSGNDFISVDKDGVSTVLGSIPGTDTTSLPYSFNTQGIVADGRFFLYSPTGGFSEVTDPNLGDPIDCVWVDNYYFFTDGEFIYHSDLADESAIDPLKFATSEFSPDPTLGVDITPDNKVMVFNRFSIEYFENRAQENFAFQRLSGRTLKIGIIGTHCKAEILDQHFIMGGRKEEAVGIFVVSVGNIVKTSSREVDKILSNYSEEQLRTAVLEARAEDNYHYILVHLPDKTLLYNITLSLSVGTEMAWSILESGAIQQGINWRAKFGIFEPRRSQWIYGDKIDSRLGILDDKEATHYGTIAEWMLNTPFMYFERASIDQLEIEIIPGFTTTEDAGVFVSITYDGITHSTEITMQYGGPSEYLKRFIQRRFGYVTDWMAFRLRGASRSRMAFSRAFINYG